MPLSPSCLTAPLVCALTLAACATAGSSPETLLSERTPSPGRRCIVAPGPASLPAVDVLVDSAALHRAVGALAPRGGYAVLSVGFDRNGWNSHREVVEHDLTPAAADSLQALVFAHRRTTAPGEPWGARLRIDLGGNPRFHVGRQEICPARLVDGVARVAQLGAVTGPQERFAAYQPQSTVWVRVLVDERGDVADARLEYGGLSSRSETMLLGYIRTLGFEPATVDGIAVPSWARLPLPMR